MNLENISQTLWVWLTAFGFDSNVRHGLELLFE